MKKMLKGIKHAHNQKQYKNKNDPVMVVEHYSDYKIGTPTRDASKKGIMHKYCHHPIKDLRFSFGGSLSSQNNAFN
jgi:hypothetical protein